MSDAKEPNLMEILTELTQYCDIDSVGPIKLKLTLPKNVLHRFNLKFIAKEKIKLAGSEEQSEPGLIRTVYTQNGIVELFVDEETKVEKL